MSLYVDYQAISKRIATEIINRLDQVEDDPLQWAVINTLAKGLDYFSNVMPLVADNCDVKAPTNIFWNNIEKVEVPE